MGRTTSYGLVERVAVLILLYVLALPGCKGRAASSASPTPATDSASRNRLDVLWDTPNAFDPISTDKSIESTLLNLLHDRLTFYDPVSGKLLPGLAQSYERSEDEHRWTFHLRDAHTPDGEALDAQTVVRSLGLYLDSRFESSERPNLILGGVPLQVAALDAKTVLFTTSQATPFLPWILADINILPMQLYHQIAKDPVAFRAALSKTAAPRWLRGFGPFFVETRTAQEIVLRRNPRFWGRDSQGQQLPYLDGLSFTLVDDPQVRETSFLNNERYAFTIPDSLALPQFAGKPGWQVRNLGPDGSAMFFWLNQNPHATGVAKEKLKLFRSPEFRRALAHGLIRERVIDKAVLGNGRPLLGPVSPCYPWGLPSDDLLTVTPEYNLQKARQELAALGVKDTDGDGVLDYTEGSGRQPLSIYLYTTRSPGGVREAATKEVARQLQSLGILAKFEVIEFNSAISKILQTFDYEAMLMILSGAEHPAAGRKMYHSSGRMHFFAPNQPAPLSPWEQQVDQDVDHMLTAKDERSGLATFMQLQRQWVQAQPVFYLMTRTQYLVVRSKYELTGAAATGQAVNPVLDRPFIEHVKLGTIR